MTGYPVCDTCHARPVLIAGWDCIVCAPQPCPLCGVELTRDATEPCDTCAAVFEAELAEWGGVR